MPWTAMRQRGASANNAAKSKIRRYAASGMDQQQGLLHLVHKRGGGGYFRSTSVNFLVMHLTDINNVLRSNTPTA